MSAWQQIAQASSKRVLHACDGVPGANKCRNCRWFEVIIWSRRVPNDPLTPVLYRVRITGRSRVPGELDRETTEETTSPAAVVDFLTLGAAGERYIPRVSRLALHTAGEQHPKLEEALSRFDHPTNLNR